MRRLKAAWLTPCLGVGGADAQMCGIIQYGNASVDWCGVAVERFTSAECLDWALRSTGRTPIHLVRTRERNGQREVLAAGTELRRAGVHYHETFAAAALAATADADVVCAWGVESAVDVYPAIDGPIIEMIQGTGEFATGIAAKSSPLATVLIACSDAARKAFPPDLRANAAVIYNGADPARCLPRLGRQWKRSQWQIPDGSRVLLFVGRLDAGKNAEAHLQALSCIGDLHAVFVGRGPYTSRIEDLAQRFCPGQVRFEPWTYHLGDVLAAADAYMLISDHEGDPLSLHEAHFAGVPAVVTELPVVREIEAAHGQMSVTVPMQPNTKQIVGGVLAALHRDHEPIRQHAQRVTLEHFALPRLAAQWELLVHQVAHDHRLARICGRPKTIVGPAPIE